MKKYQMTDKSMDLTDKSNERCIGCKKCMAGCPMLDRFCENPKHLLDELSADKNFGSDIAYSCMLCGYCDEVCPVDVSLNDLFFSYRESLHSACEGSLPKDLNLGGVDFHQNLSFSKVFSKYLKNSHKTVFFPGCALIGAKPTIVPKVNSYLDERLGGCELMTHCCGKPTNYMGKNKKFISNMENIQSEIDRNNVETLVAGCLNCYKTLENNLKNVKVIPLWTLLDELDIVSDLNLDYSNLDIAPTIHDPCPTRQDNDIHDSIRNLLNDMNVDYHEMDFNRNETLCCGAGAMVSISQKHISEAHMKRRCNESKSDHIVTYCQECTESFISQGLNSFHILDLLFDNYKNIDFTGTKLLNKWINRGKVSNGKRL